MFKSERLHKQNPFPLMGYLYYDYEKGSDCSEEGNFLWGERGKKYAAESLL